MCVARSCRYLDLMLMDLDKRALKMFIRKCRFRKCMLQFVASFLRDFRGQRSSVNALKLVKKEDFLTSNLPEK